MRFQTQHVSARATTLAIALGLTAVLVVALPASGSGAMAERRAAAPTISSFSPTSGPVGTGVYITGSNFIGATSVTFGGTASAFSPLSGTSMGAPVPPGATTGRITITTPGGTVTSATDFTVTAPPEHVDPWSGWKLVDQGEDWGHIAVDGSTRNYRHVGFEAYGFTNRIEGTWKVRCAGGFTTSRHFGLVIKYSHKLKIPAGQGFCNEVIRIRDVYAEDGVSAAIYAR